MDDDTDQTVNQIPDENSEQTESIYERAGIGHRMGFGNTIALVVVDLQYGMTDPDNPLGSDLDETVSNTNELVKQAHKNEIPVIFTRVIARQQEGDDLGIWTKKVPNLTTLKPDTRWVKIDERLETRDTDHILEKRQASAFHETELNSMLTSMGVDTVVVTGCTTSGCVRATVIDACSSGYHTIVPEGCTGDRSQRQHESNMFDMDAKYADVVDLDTVVEAFSHQGTIDEEI